MKILFIMRDDGGCGFYRCLQPAKFIKRMGLADTEVVLREPTREQLLSADLVVMQEMGSVNASDIARFCIEQKIPYITEFDDYIQHVSPRNLYGYPAWNPSTLYIHRAMEMTRSAFATQVCTNQLAREYFPYNPTIFVIPNYLDQDLWTVPLGRKMDGKIRIGWAGGNAHADDLHMISGVLEKLVKEFKGKVVFETMGMTAQELHGVFNMKQVKDDCPSCGYAGEIHHHPGESLQNYPLTLAGLGWDIAVAPVINNGFGNAKSDLKLKEYSALGVPMVASAVVPYIEAKRDGCDVLLATTYEEWYNHLKDLIKSEQRRAEIVKNNKKWVGNYYIQDNADKIFEVYEQLIIRARQILGRT